MAQKSKIEWTDATWNPTRGCTKVSPGCTHCYAERFAERWRGIPGHPYELGFQLRLVPELLDAPLHWRAPRSVFVNSMSDVLHKDVPPQYVRDVFKTMAAAPQHRFQLLTKRPERLVELAPTLVIPDNVWIGVSIENADYLWRAELLKQVPCRIRFLSLEPLLGPLTLDLDGIQWVIVGGESGPKCRPMDPAWVRSIRDQCSRAKVPFFLKQWGGTFKSRTGRLLDGRTWDEYPVAGAGQEKP